MCPFSLVPDALLLLLHHPTLLFSVLLDWCWGNHLLMTPPAALNLMIVTSLPTSSYQRSLF